MLEQFRILQAALRLREFTLSDLARESRVALGTVQKTLRRTAELFSSREGPPTGRRGSSPKIHSIRLDSVREALQAEADSISLPDLPPSLGARLAEDTLLRMFPRAKLEERADLIEAAEEHLSLSPDA